MMTKKPKVVVMGGGPGGYAAAFMAADQGLDVTLVDIEKNPGGVCLYRGCIPSKALLHVAKVLTESQEAKNWGVTFSKPKINLGKMRSWKNNVITQMTNGLGQLCQQRKINYLQGRASFLDSHHIKIMNDQGQDKNLKFDYAIIATGSRPAVIEDLMLENPNFLNSSRALEFKNIPKKLLVIGGGYIGLELSTVYAALGTKVTVVEMMAGLLPGADRDLVRPLAKRCETLFHKIYLNTKVTSLQEKKNGITATFEGKDIDKPKQVFDQVLMSVGRRPNSSGIGLQNTHVTTDSKGFIIVDGERRTVEPHILAIGDVAGEPMLAHKATHEGRLAAEVIAGKKMRFEPQAIPAVVFTDPEIAWCGLTETQAKAEKRKIKSVRFPWAASGRATTLDRNEGVTKLIIDPDTERVLGVGIVGPGAGELIAEGTLAVEMGALASDMALTIHPHPTLSETLMEAADTFYGQSTHVYRPKR
jgi:dihydrolipoamide dehydrogenase